MVLALLVLACLAAFFITQRLKHTPTSVQNFKLTTRFSPFPAGRLKQEGISFKLARADAVTVTIIDSTGDLVATLVRAYPVQRYKQFSLRWNGRRGSALGYRNTTTASARTILVPVNRGAIAPPGEYRVRVSLRHRSVPVLSPRSFTLVGSGGLVSAAPATSLPAVGTIAAGTAVAIVVIAALALLMRWREEAFPLLAVLALPFRLPISADGKTVNLLIPLYLVVAAGTLVHLLPRLRERVRGGEARRLDPAGAATGAQHSGSGEAEEASPGQLAFWGTPRGVQWLLFAAVGLYAVQAIYSADHARALENVAFFYVPFALLFLLLSRVRWTRELLLRCLGVAVVLALLLAGVGFVEYARKSLFLNPKVVAANQYDNYFRVNSLFFDPNIYGRFLALVMIAVSTVVLWSTRRRELLIGAAVLAWLLGGLVTSFSQSSIAALLLGLALLAAWRWDVRATLYASVGLVALAGAIVLLAPASLHFGLKGTGGSTSNATNGRTKLISRGLELFADRPLQGYGSGSFQKEYESRHKTSVENATSASHTIPITVAAEQGIVGLALYVALLVVAFLVLFGGAGRSPPRIAIAACFAALVLHTFAYADFLEDPLTWTLLGIGVALARDGEPTPGDRSARAGGDPAAAA